MSNKAPRPDERPRAPRSDVTRNRALLLVAAAEVFAERGADASLEEIARRAKVGIGTLYRHFPTRDALLLAAGDEKLLAIAEESRVYRGAPLRALTRFLGRIVEHSNRYRGLAASFGLVLHAHTPGCQAATAEGHRLLERAEREGAIRAGVSLDDLLAITAALSIAAEQAPPDERRTDRLVQLLIEGLRAR